MNGKILFFLSLLMVSCSQSTFTRYETKFFDETKEEWVKIERMKNEDGLVQPYPIGGTEGIVKNIKYPENAYENRIEGYVYAVCFVDEVGLIQKIEITQGLGYGCDEAVKEGIRKVKFLPGLKDDKPIKSKITIPIKFKWQEKNNEKI